VLPTEEEVGNAHHLRGRRAVKDEQPVVTDFGVALASTALPVEQDTRIAVAPEI